MLNQLLDVSLYSFRLQAIPTFIAAVGVLVLGIFCGMDQRRAPAGDGLFVLALPTTVWLFAFSWMYLAATEEVALWWARLGALGVAFIPAAVYQFAVQLVGTARQRRRLVWGGWSLAVVFAGLLLFSDAFLQGVTLYRWGYYPRYGMVGILFLLFFLAAVIATFTEWLIAGQHIPPGAHRSRLKAFLLAFGVAFLAAVDFIPKFGIPFYPFGYLPLFAAVGWIIRAIKRYGLLEYQPVFTAEKALAAIADPLMVYDREGRVRLVNPAMCSILGYSEAELLGIVMGQLLEGEVYPPAEESWPWQSSFQDLEVVFFSKEGQPVDLQLTGWEIFDENGLRAGTVVLAKDIRQRKRAERALQRASREFGRWMEEKTAELARTNTNLQLELIQRRQVEEQLAYKATHDTLTGLPNRAAFMKRLEQEVERAKHDPVYQFAVLFLDFDRFKEVNDTLGHAVGDQLLVAIARRLQSQLRATDMVARLGGDEFVILLSNIQDASNVPGIVERLQNRLNQPYTLEAHEIVSTVSIGVVLSEAGYDRAEHLLEDADMAMYRAKAAGKARYEVFQADVSGD